MGVLLARPDDLTRDELIALLIDAINTLECYRGSRAAFECYARLRSAFMREAWRRRGGHPGACRAKIDTIESGS